MPGRRGLPPNPPNPGAVAPLRPHDWSRYRWSRTDDGDDCVSSSFEESMRLRYGEPAPDLPDLEAAYRRWHPTWNDDPSTMRLDWYWEALLSIDVRVEALHQMGGDLVGQIVSHLNAGYFPTAWIYLWNPYTSSWLHHAVVIVAHYDNWLVVYDQQRGFGWEYDKTLFARTGLDGATSGYAYIATWLAAPAPEPEPAPEEDPVPLDMYLGAAPELAHHEVDDTLHELSNIYRRMEKLPESPRKRQAELGIIAIKRALTGVE